MIGEDEPYVIKLAGYDGTAVALDQLGAAFGFSGAGARVVRKGDEQWPVVECAVDEAGVWNRENTAEPGTQALLMNKVIGDELHETVDSVSAVDPAQPTGPERGCNRSHSGCSSVGNCSHYACCDITWSSAKCGE